MVGYIHIEALSGQLFQIWGDCNISYWTHFQIGIYNDALKILNHAQFRYTKIL